MDGNAVWEQNWAGFGGGIRLYLDCLLSVSGSATFVRNSGKEGAGIWLSASSTIEALGSSIITFHSNTVSHVGGGILAYDTKVNFLAGSTVQFSNNTAGKYGGGIHIWAGDIANLEGHATFLKNTALTGGGMHVARAGAWHHYGVTVMSGNAASSGGAIYGDATA